MRFGKFALILAALGLAAAPLAAEIQPAVQPGGDIPKEFRPIAPIPKGGDIPAAFDAPRAEFHYVRREAMIPMRDGAKLYTVLILPKGVRKAPIVLDRTPYSAAKATRRGTFGPIPEQILSPAYAELVRAGYVVAVRNVPEGSGRVATIGTSYNGFTALMSLVNPHPALKASVPINPMVDVWKGDDWFHNGAFRQEMISYVYGQTASKKSDED